MSACTSCGSGEIHLGVRGRDHARPELCDACFWRERANAAEARLEVLNRLTQRRSHAKSLGAAIEGDAVIMARLQGERELAERLVAAVVAAIEQIASPAFMTEDLVDEAVQAWNDTPMTGHGHLVSNRFERKQVRSALAILVARAAAVLRRAVAPPANPGIPPR